MPYNLMRWLLSRRARSVAALAHKGGIQVHLDFSELQAPAQLQHLHRDDTTATLLK